MQDAGVNVALNEICSVKISWSGFILEEIVVTVDLWSRSW